MYVYVCESLSGGRGGRAGWTRTRLTPGNGSHVPGVDAGWAGAVCTCLYVTLVPTSQPVPLQRLSLGRVRE